MASPQHCILISLGSNINKELNTRKGLDALHRMFGSIILSPIYESKSIGFDGDNFYNSVVLAYTDKSIAQVCNALKGIEDDCGRTRHSAKFSPRTLDLDLLTYDDVICSEPISLPREEITYNAFVLQPMADIVPEHIHPVTKKSYAHMWQAFDKSQQQLWPVPFTWSVDPA
jgi:2-amino-4-hydroxy-6-hydroxymethyldihydropteridine diphosphokinase